jgi:hypothetical protein
MKRTTLTAAAVIAALAVAGVAAIDRAMAQEMFSNTRAVVEFQRAADAYAFLHRQVERRIGMAHRRTGEPFDEIGARELAAGIIAERPRPAVLFAPAVVAVFRDAALQALRAGCDAGELRTGVWEMFHDPYTPAAGTRALTPCMVTALPELPDELEYRSAGTVLLLVDPHANLVIDVLPALLAGSEIR